MKRRLYKPSLSEDTTRGLILAIILGILYGITDEFHQSFVPGRSSSEWNVLADSIGVIIAQAGIIVLTIKHFWGKKSKKTIDISKIIILITIKKKGNGGSSL